MNVLKRVSGLLVIFYLLICGPALGQEVRKLVEPVPAPDNDSYNSPDSQWSLTLGAGALLLPEYEGSSDYRILPMPVVDFRYGKYFSISTTRGLEVYLYNDSNLEVGPSLNYRFGRDQDDSDDLEGLGDVDGGFTAGGFVRYNLRPFRFSLQGDQGLGRAKGFLAEAEALYQAPAVAGWNPNLGVSAAWADSRYNEAYFGINETQSLRSGYREYDPGAGFKHVALSAGASHALGENFNVNVFGEYRRLVGPAADSPLVEQGSRNQGLLGLSLSWHFQN